MLAFNLAVLPQSVGPAARLPVFLAYALTLTLVGRVVLLTLVVAAAKSRAALQSRRTQRVLDGATGLVMLGFAGALTAEA